MIVMILIVQQSLNVMGTIKNNRKGSKGSPKIEGDRIESHTWSKGSKIDRNDLNDHNELNDNNDQNDQRRPKTIKKLVDHTVLKNLVCEDRAEEKFFGLLIFGRDFWWWHWHESWVVVIKSRINLFYDVHASFIVLLS